MSHFINQDWISDEHIEFLAEMSKTRPVDDPFSLEPYLSECDREIRICCNVEGVKIADIPVDDDGFVTSDILAQYGIAYLSYLILKGYWGSRKGNRDIYYEKMFVAEKHYKELRKRITIDTIDGLENADGSIDDKTALLGSCPY